MPAHSLILVTDEARHLDCKMLIDKTILAFGRLDILINNAECEGYRDDPVPELLQAPQILIKSPMRLTRLALPYLKQSEQASVINIATFSGRFPLDGDPPYSSSQFGLRGFCFALADDLRQAGARLCSIAPGSAETHFVIEQQPPLTFDKSIKSSSELAQAVFACATPRLRERSILTKTQDFGALGYLFA